MRERTSRFHLCTLSIFVMLIVACISIVPTPKATATQTPAIPTPFIPTATATFAPPQANAQFIAYIRDRQLMVTDVTNGVRGGTTQYTMTGESDQVNDLVWSPSGEFVAFVASPKGD